MPSRALVWMLVTVALGLLAVGMWVRAVSPLLAEANAAADTQPGRLQPATQDAKPQTGEGRIAEPAAEQSLRRLVHGTLLLAFVLICMLLVVGMAATFREWVRYWTGPGRERKRGAKTKYVDAWKIAGERMPPEGPDSKSGSREE